MKNEAPEIVRIAEGLERELCALEDAARKAGDIRLHDERSLEKAGKALQEGLAQQAALGDGLKAFSSAMGRMAERQQGAIDRLAARAQEIQAQMNRLAEHMQRFGQLGAKAAEASRILQGLPAPYGTGEPGTAGSPPAELLQVDALLAAVSAEAKELASSAEEADLSQVASEAGALRQRIDSARAQLSLLAEGRPPIRH